MERGREVERGRGRGGDGERGEGRGERGEGRGERGEGRGERGEGRGERGEGDRDFYCYLNNRLAYGVDSHTIQSDIM